VTADDELVQALKGDVLEPARTEGPNARLPVSTMARDPRIRGRRPHAVRLVACYAGGMSQDVELGCRCGAINGWVRGVSRGTVNRAICYCDDCQAFLHYLGRAELLDVHGGTDIVQVAPAAVTFDRGAERIVGLRLGPRGLHRWYASCCKTPLGNTMTPSIPFIGMASEVFRGMSDVRRRDQVFGRVRGSAFSQYAAGAPAGSGGLQLRMFAHAVRLMLGWKLRGRAWPHPFFDAASRAPSHPVTTLSPGEREALRSKCGPHPGTFAASPP
jgi:hypothetical protein